MTIGSADERDITGIHYIASERTEEPRCAERLEVSGIGGVDVTELGCRLGTCGFSVRAWPDPSDVF
jgi:hypothetical protein